MEKPRQHGLYAIGPFRLDVEAGVLTQDGEAVPLGPRAVAVLAALVGRGNTFVTKAALMDAAWPGLVVEEANLPMQVSAIRRALARVAGGADWIETLPRRGYRFVGPVSPVAGAASSAAAASPRPADSLAGHLPAAVTSFVGRVRELDQVKALLAGHRLVTLLGVGGIGKTRLSLQVAMDLAPLEPAGAWFVELAPLADPRLVTQAVASALGVKEGAGEPVLDALLAAIKQRRMLLILDNCEHLVEAVAALVHRLLQSAAQLRILATSREPLRVPGEASFQVPPLGLPDPGEAPGSVALPQSESARLFVDRASAVNAMFAIDEGNAVAVRNICHRLDGIPLAIELAAARVRTMSVEQIEARLVDRFQLLRHGDRTVSARQQTLRALIDWSHDLLPEQERIVFRRLAVFAGGWTLPAAEEVASDSPIGRADVLDGLGNLTEKSLVVMDAEGGRYRLLETIRQYAQERLGESNEEDATRHRHFDHFLALAQADASDETGWLARVDPELDNLLAAHAWCGRAEEGGRLGLALVAALGSFWIHRGRMELGHRVMAEALARPGAQERSLARSQALSAAGYHDYFMGRADEALRSLEESLSIAKENGDRGQAASSLFRLAVVHLSRRAFAAARGHAEESLRLASDVGDVSGIAKALSTQGLISRTEGDASGAARLFREALVHERPRGKLSSIAGILANLAECALQLGAGDEARGLLREALAMAEQVQSKWRVAFVLDCCAALAALDDDPERAARYFGAIEALLRATGLRREPDDALVVLPLVEKARAVLGSEAFEQLETQGEGLPYAEVVADMRAWLDRGAGRGTLRELDRGD